MIKNIEVTKLGISIYGEYADKDACKSIPTRRWNPDLKCWQYEFSLTVLENIKKVFPTAYKQFGLSKYINKSRTLDKPEKRAKISNASINKMMERLDTLNGTLMPFQRESVAYALEKKHLFFADEMGLGKTVQALATLHATQHYPAIIICPAVVKYNWAVEAERWLPNDVRVVVIKDAKSVNDAVNADVVVLTYDLFTKLSKNLVEIKFRFMILDESHYVKNGTAKRTKIVKAFAKEIDYVLLLSGTPLLSRPAELIEQLRVISRFDEFGGWNRFTDRYCAKKRKPWGWDISGSANLKELNTRLREICYIRHDKKAVLQDLPDKTRSQVFFELTKPQMKEYEKAKKQLEDYLRENLQKDEREIKKSMKAEMLVRIEVLKNLVAKQKLDDAKEWVSTFLESGEKLVVFATHLEVIESLCEAFPDAVSITGETSAEERQRVVEVFQSDDNVKLAILGLKAASTGITLTAASNVAFLELGWTPADMQQAEDRVYRIGQRNAVNVWYLLAKDTIDVEIATLIDMKSGATKAAIEGVDVGQDDKILDKMVEFLSPALGAVRTKKKGNCGKKKEDFISDNNVLF